MTDQRTGPHGASHSAVHKKLHSWTFLPFLQFFGGGIYAPDPSTYDPIEILLNAEGEEQDVLTARWRDNKLSELNFVGVVVCHTQPQSTCSSFRYPNHRYHNMFPRYLTCDRQLS
jgi:hypothetical protein